MSAFDLGKSDADRCLAYANPYTCYSEEWKEYRKGYYMHTPPYIWPTSR